MPTTEELIELEAISIPSDTELVELSEGIELVEGIEVDIDDLLEDAFSLEKEKREEYERKLQKLYANTPYYQSLRQKIYEASLLSDRIEQGRAVVCDRCGSVYEIGEWPLCGLGYGREHGRVISKNAQTATVTAYYVNRRTGKIWIPGQNKYREPIDRTGRRIAGYERHEVKNFRDRDNFYRLMDNAAKKKYYSSLAREQQMFEPIFAEGRKQARQDIISSENSSPEASYGREWLQQQVKKTEAEAKKKLNYNPNTFIDPWEYNQQNLDNAGISTLNETLAAKQPVLSEKHKKAIGRAVRKNTT